jgi:FkbM family methyltransferase
LRERLFYRFLVERQHWFPNAFNRGTLDAAPGCRMPALVCGDVISGQIALTGFYERSLTAWLTAKARNPGGLLVDVGANLGYFSILWLAQNPANRVIAIEASPRNIPALSDNLEANGFLPRVELLPIAVGDRSGTVPFHLGPPAQTGWGGLAPATAEDPGGNEVVEVPMKTLDSLLAERSEPIALLKLDVEGAEPMVLRGASQLLAARRVAALYFEENQERTRSLADHGTRSAHSLLTEAGYTVAPLNPASSHSTDWIALCPHRV